MLKVILSLVSIVIAALFSIILPGTGIESIVITLIGAIAGFVGITDWRLKYDQTKEWFKSKTIIGALLVVLPLIALVLLPLIGVQLNSTIVTLLTVIATGSGAFTVYGIWSAVSKSEKN